MDVKALIDEANKYADKAIRQSYIEAKASRFRAWITEPVVVYRLHFAVMTAFLAAFVIYEFIIY